MIQLVTYDFHNTIAHCDDWFQLEIRELPVRVLERANSGYLERIGAENLTAKYREMRQGVMDSGVEIEAIEGLERVYREFDIDLDRDELEKHTADLMRAAVETAGPIDGSVESIRMLADAGMRIGVISSAIYHPFLEWTLL